MEASEDVGETCKRDFDEIEMDLEITILMVEEQENIVVLPLLEQENANEDGEPHAHIDGSDIAPPILSNGEEGCNFFGSNLRLQYLPQLWSLNLCLPHLPSPCEKMGGAFLFCLNL